MKELKNSEYLKNIYNKYAMISVFKGKLYSGIFKRIFINDNKNIKL